MLVKVLDVDPMGIARVVDARYVKYVDDGAGGQYEVFPQSHIVDAFISTNRRGRVREGLHYSMYPCNYFRGDAFIRYEM
jgi:hypothetical protein